MLSNFIKIGVDHTPESMFALAKNRAHDARTRSMGIEELILLSSDGNVYSTTLGPAANDSEKLISYMVMTTCMWWIDCRAIALHAECYVAPENTNASDLISLLIGSTPIVPSSFVFTHDVAVSGTDFTIVTPEGSERKKKVRDFQSPNAHTLQIVQMAVDSYLAIAESLEKTSGESDEKIRELAFAQMQDEFGPKRPRFISVVKPGISGLN